MDKKRCSVKKGCGLEKDVSEFRARGKKKDGDFSYQSICIQCQKLYAAQYRSNNPNKIKQYRTKNSEKYKQTKKQWYDNNKEKISEIRKQYNTNNIEKIMLIASIRRARQKGLEHNINLEDIVIPESCPVLGITIENNHGKGFKAGAANSPSLDRIDNSKGYVKGNVWVISHRANTIKGDATIEELEKVLRYMKGESDDTANTANPANTA